MKSLPCFFCLWGRGRFCSHMGVTFSKRHVLYAFCKAPATQNPIVNARKSCVERDVLETASRRLLRDCALKGRVERDVLKTASRRLLRGCALKGRVERDVLKTSPPCAAFMFPHVRRYSRSIRIQQGASAQKIPAHSISVCGDFWYMCVCPKAYFTNLCVRCPLGAAMRRR